MDSYIGVLLTKQFNDIQKLLDGCNILINFYKSNNEYINLLKNLNKNTDIQKILNILILIYFKEFINEDIKKLSTDELINICKMLKLNSKGNISQMTTRLLNVKNKILSGDNTIEIDEYTFEEIKNKCKNLNINIVGTKTQLCEKLNNYYKGHLQVNIKKLDNLEDINEYKKIDLEKICEELKINKDGTKLDIYNRIKKYYELKNNEEIINNKINDFKNNLNENTTKELIEYCIILNLYNGIFCNSSK